jgi:hypothetical protein
MPRMSKTANTEWSQTPRRTVYRLCASCLAILSAVVSVGRAQDQVQSTQGELKIEGTHIARLVLRRDDDHTEEWSNLRGSIQLPVGTYRVKQLTLRDSCSCQPESLTKLGPIEISADTPAVLKAGGPVQQSIAVNRRGSMLTLGYALHGIGGEEYTPRPAARAKFTAYRGRTVIATGAFEYG